MPTFAIQYLESLYPDASPNTVRQCLRQACERLPISFVLLGWDLPRSIEEAVAQEATRQHAQLFRWQPVLTGDAHTNIPPEWTTIGPDYNPIPGYGGRPEFSFICPNRNAVADFLMERMESVSTSGFFKGLFLDRIRFPSPSYDPLHELACFCKDCIHHAADIGLDLEMVRRAIHLLPAHAIVHSLLGQPTEAGSLLESFLDFRAASITRIVRTIANQAHALKLSIGLDCFSPSLTRMVGQDLSSLNESADWIKIMTYPRVFGPAGISFELFGLAKWLTKSGLGEAEIIQHLAEASGLPIPANLSELSRVGLESRAITLEIMRGHEVGVTNLFAGIAMVLLEKVHESTPKQIQSDLKASRKADGLIISWDLWLTPLKYLDRIRNLWS